MPACDMPHVSALAFDRRRLIATCAVRFRYRFGGYARFGGCRAAWPSCFNSSVRSRIPPLCCRFISLPCLVCPACQLSVSVRLACSAERDLQGTRDTTPALCSVCCCSPRLHPSWRRWCFPVGSRSIELSHYPRLGGARATRDMKRRPLRNGQWDEPHCSVVVCDAPGSPSRGRGTGKIGWKPAPILAPCAASRPASRQ